MSARTLRITLTVLSVLGLGWAGYLTWVHYSGAAPLCSIKGNPCSQVQKSTYSELAGVPVALIGAIGYLAILATLLVRETENARLATMGLTLGGFGFSAYLTYREVFTLHKICEDCVASAVIMTILTCLAVWRFLRSEPTGVEMSDASPGDAPEPGAQLGATSA